MALITCPECGGQVSDKADHCIHCGYPLTSRKDDSFYSIILNGYKWTKSIGKDATQRAGAIIITEMKLEQHYLVSKQDARKLSNKYPSTILTGITEDNVQYVLDDFTNLGCIVESVPEENGTFNPINEEITKRISIANAPVTCPRCHSTSITTGARGANFTFGFLGASKTVNRCSNCGYTWYPGK